jgi:hypothetical protein
VWDFFEKVEWKKGGEDKTARCKVRDCNRILSCGTEGGTTTLWRHFERLHFAVYVQTEEYARKKKREGGGDEAVGLKNDLLISSLTTCLDTEHCEIRCSCPLPFPTLPLPTIPSTIIVSKI